MTHVNLFPVLPVQMFFMVNGFFDKKLNLMVLSLATKPIGFVVDSPNNMALTMTKHSSQLLNQAPFVLSLVLLSPPHGPFINLMLKMPFLMVL
jgi:hypothetical protein